MAEVFADPTRFGALMILIGMVAAGLMGAAALFRSKPWRDDESQEWKPGENIAP